MGEITITIAIVCGLMLAVFLLVTFVEDKRRKMRKKSRREAEKVLAGQGDPMRKEQNFMRRRNCMGKSNCTGKMNCMRKRRCTGKTI